MKKGSKKKIQCNVRMKQQKMKEKNTNNNHERNKNKLVKYKKIEGKK